MANAAGTTEDKSIGTPTQATLDAQVAALEYVPPTAYVEAKIAELNKYLADMMEAEEKGDETAYAAIKAKMEKVKQDLLDELNKAKAAVSKKIHDTVDPILKSLEDQIKAPFEVDPLKKLAEVDVDLSVPTITVTPNFTIPTSISEVVEILKDIICALVPPMNPLLKVAKWWITDYIPKMTAYIQGRVSMITSLISRVESIGSGNISNLESTAEEVVSES